MTLRFFYDYLGMYTATAVAPANIAFSKYWGKSDSSLNIPYSDTISMNLSGVETQTTVTFSPDIMQDSVVLNGHDLSGQSLKRVTDVLDIVRERAGVSYKAIISTTNSFPTGAGIASSASGFAALALAATSALRLNLTQKEVSAIARRGSGSATRSIPDGFVVWHKGTSDSTSVAESIFPASHWALCNVIAVVDAQEKKESSTFGHSIAESSPLFWARVESISKLNDELKTALAEKDIEKLGVCLEHEALSLHSVMMTSNPSILYWQPATMAVLRAVRELRESGTAAYFTIDAGPNVHVICEEKYTSAVEKMLKQVSGVQKTIVAKVGDGARIV